jgi:hypothetical protein
MGRVWVAFFRVASCKQKIILEHWIEFLLQTKNHLRTLDRIFAANKKSP